MEIVLVLLIVAILIGALAFLDAMLESLIPIALNADEFLATLTGNNWFPTIMDVFFGIGISLIVLKFLYKGFNVYIGWMDGWRPGRRPY